MVGVALKARGYWKGPHSGPQTASSTCQNRRMSDLRAVIRAQRLSLIEDLNTLTPQQWASPSLCKGWSVQQIATHLA